jgi:hypothetical protein
MHDVGSPSRALRQAGLEAMPEQILLPRLRERKWDTHSRCPRLS